MPKTNHNQNGQKNAKNQQSPTQKTQELVTQSIQESVTCGIQGLAAQKFKNQSPDIKEKTKEKMRIEIDISGQVQQKNYDSALGFRRENGIVKSVYLRSKIKKEIISKYKNQVTNLIEKIHCIMIYLCIKGDLKDVKEIKICSDINYRKLRKLLPLLFKDFNYLEGIKIKPRKGDEPKSAAHRFALRTFRRRKYASLIITKEVIEKYLFEFKEK